MHTGWGKSRANTSSLWDRRGGRLYCSINSSINTGEGRRMRVCFFHPCIPRPSLVLSALSALGQHRRQLIFRTRDGKVSFPLGFLHLDSGARRWPWTQTQQGLAACGRGRRVAQAWPFSQVVTWRSGKVKMPTSTWSGRTWEAPGQV